MRRFRRPILKAPIIRIGTFQGIRLPKALLKKAKLGDVVELRAEPGRILVSKNVKPRIGWAEAARRMRAQGEDNLLDPPTATRFDKEDW